MQSTTDGYSMQGERTPIVQPPQTGRPPAVPPSQGQTTVMRAQQPAQGGPQAPTMVTPMGPPPRPPMGAQMDQPQRPPMGQVVTQDRPHERPPAGGRRPVRRTGAASYARSLAPLVGMSIVVVVLIAGITAWISSVQERPAAPPAPRPAAGTTTTASPFPSSAVVPSAPKATPKPKPKATAPAKVVPPVTSSKAANAAPTSATQKTTQAVRPSNVKPSETPDDTTNNTENCGGLFQQPC
jgi:hypothetical protein